MVIGDGQALEFVEEFIYQGSNTSRNGDLTNDVEKRH